MKRNINKDILSAEEIEKAEELCIRNVQGEYFAPELASLNSLKPIPTNSSVCSLAPFLDENGILRVKGRLEESELRREEKHPILLPRNSRFTELIVLREHIKFMHSGVGITLTRLRQRYWVPKGRQVVRKVINKCLICKRYSVKPSSQMTGQLPKDRILESPPFSVTGVDFTGPVYVKSGEEIQKSYIVLFTCGVTRAVHLELVSDLSTKKFILALRRFLSRRGNTKIIYSDNAKTFKSASKDLQYFSEIIKNKELQNFASSEGITWKFIVELAPWWGGFYERLMRSIKEPLRKVLGRAQLTFEEIMTILAEIENILNQRPLTYVFNDKSEPEPLTPAHFLLVGRKIDYPYNFVEMTNSSSTKEGLIKRKQYQSKILAQIWKKWKEEYLLNNRHFHNLTTPRVERDLQVGDIVLLEGASKSKFMWDLGQITKAMKGRDGLVRSCVVKTKNGEFRRPIQLIYPLEISD